MYWRSVNRDGAVVMDLAVPGVGNDRLEVST